MNGELNNGELLRAISDELVARGQPSVGVLNVDELIALVDISRHLGVGTVFSILDTLGEVLPPA